MADKNDIVIGSFYELLDSKIAFTTGWDSRAKAVRFRFDDGEGTHSIDAISVSRDWRRRPDLEDFPDARDPMLPYVFDLFWDVKYRSRLVELLVGDHADEVKAAMQEHGVVLTDVEKAEVERLQSVRTFERR